MKSILSPFTCVNIYICFTWVMSCISNWIYSNALNSIKIPSFYYYSFYKKILLLNIFSTKYLDETFLVQMLCRIIDLCIVNTLALRIGVQSPMCYHWKIESLSSAREKTEKYVIGAIILSILFWCYHTTERRRQSPVWHERQSGTIANVLTDFCSITTAHRYSSINFQFPLHSGEYLR
jgi:hypothetical protein